MFKISMMILAEGTVTFKVGHYTADGLQPTPTERTYDKLPEAWRDAFGSAAKHSVILGKPEEVYLWDGRRYEVIARQIRGGK